MGRGTLWAASAGPAPSGETLERIAAELDVAGADEPHSPSNLFRCMRTMLNVTQKEFGILVSPEGSTPISASVVCQLETGSQAIPAAILDRAAMATSTIHAFADWRRAEQSGCFDSRLSALRALGVESEALLAPYLSSNGPLADGRADIVAAYLGVVSRRKPSTAGNRPATRGPYKKKPSAKGLDSSSSSSSAASSACSSAMSNASTSRAGSPVPSLGGESASKARARGPAKAKRRPVAVGLEGASPSGEGATELQTLKECLLDGQAVITPRTADALDFLTRLEHAERRDDEALASAAQEQEALQRLRQQCGASAGGRSPRDSPRGDCKRRAVKPVARSLAGEEISIVDLDQLDLKDFTLDELLEPSEQEPALGVDEIMELVCKQMESPRWSDFGADAALVAECIC